MLPDRVHRARLPHRARRGRSTARSGTDARRAAARRAAGVRPAARAGVHPVDQGRRGPRREHLLRRRRRPRRRRRWPTRPATSPLELYRRGRRAGAAERGIIIADTKFELGLHRRRAGAVRRGAHPRLVAVLAGRRVDARAPRRRRSTSSRVRDYLEALGWDKQPAAAALPAEVVAATSARYVEAYERITGRSFADWPGVDDARPGGAPSVAASATCASTVSSRCGCATASPTRRAPPSSGRCPPWASTASPACGWASAIRFTVEAADEAAARAEVEDMCAPLPHQPGDRGRRRISVDGGGVTARVGVVLFPGSNCEHDVVEAVAALGGEGRAALARRPCARRRRRRRRCPAASPTATTSAPAPSPGSRPVMDGGDGVRRRRRPGRRHLQRLPGAHRGRAAARRAAEEPRAQVPVHSRSSLRVETTRIGADHRRARRAPCCAIPINHFEGNYTCAPETLAELRADDRVVLRYVDNPNGSIDDIAGICSEGRNVVGLMPHPERACTRCWARPTACRCCGRCSRRPVRRRRGELLAGRGRSIAARAGRPAVGGSGGWTVRDAPPRSMPALLSTARNAELAPCGVGDALALAVGRRRR